MPTVGTPDEGLRDNVHDSSPVRANRCDRSRVRRDTTVWLQTAKVAWNTAVRRLGWKSKRLRPGSKHWVHQQWIAARCWLPAWNHSAIRFQELRDDLYCEGCSHSERFRSFESSASSQFKPSGQECSKREGPRSECKQPGRTRNAAAFLHLCWCRRKNQAVWIQ